MQQGGDVNLRKTANIFDHNYRIITAYAQLRFRNPHVTDNFLVKWTVIIRSNFQKCFTLH